MSPGFIVWFTGLSGSGKSTLAALVSDEIRSRGIHVECLDGDEVRKNLSWGLGFSREDRDRNVERSGYVARMVARAGSCAITAAISPYRAVRDGVRAQSDRFCEVYCECPISVLSERDPKGLYKRALAGEIKNFTGVDDPYEAPISADVHLRTDQETPETCARKIVDFLESASFLNSEMVDAPKLPTPYGGEITDVPHRKETSTQAAIEVSLEVAHYVSAMAAGYLSPVRGFMTQREASRVIKGKRLERGLPWQEPILLDIPAEEVENLVDGAEVSLVHQDRYLGQIQVQQVWNRVLDHADKEARWYVAGLLLGVCSTRTALPGARELRRHLEACGSQTVPVYFASPSDLDATIQAQMRAVAQACGSLVLFADEHVGPPLSKLLEGTEATVVVYPGGVRQSLRQIVAQNAGGTRIIESFSE